MIKRLRCRVVDGTATVSRIIRARTRVRQPCRESTSMPLNNAVEMLTTARGGPTMSPPHVQSRRRRARIVTSRSSQLQARDPQSHPGMSMPDHERRTLTPSRVDRRRFSICKTQCFAKRNNPDVSKVDDWGKMLTRSRVYFGRPGAGVVTLA